MLSHRERTVHAWKGVLGSIGGEEDQCLKIFTLSYKDLPTTLKPCFLYFGLFPEDYEIEAFEIIQMWAGEGFIRGSGERKAEDVGEDYLNHLISRNLIQVGRRNFDGRIKSIRIHDILHSLCVRVAKETSFFIIINDEVTGNSAMRIHRVTSKSSNLGVRTFFNNFRTAELRAVLCFAGDDWGKLKRKQVKKYLRESKCLRVLSLKCRKLSIAMPSEIGNLRHLSYVRLSVQSGSYGELPTTISNLENLVTLDIRGCYNMVIPHIIWNMKKLRHILLSEFCEIKFDSRGLLRNMDNILHSTEAASVNIQTLYGLMVRYFPENYSFPKFTNLKKLGFSFGSGSNLSKAEVLLDSIIVPHKLEILRLRYLSHLPFNIMNLNMHRYENLLRLHLYGPMMMLSQYDILPQTLTKLTLVHTFLESDPMDTLKKLPILKVLKFGYNSYLRKTMVVRSQGGPNNFPQLQILKIEGLPYLKQLIVEGEVMPHLAKLVIVNCNMEKSIPRRIHAITEIM
ncbi:toMV susceptible protein tm-2-like isoform X2 [Actinidia eriantha]|uniref:toMV susceptible protein tm-2-like isoform X2 n=1 Tax=Actinidia eriantha TaxID=165200 RepID=UPI00258F01FF|nr:toMV susceptible protein tm-2-like isoform X2 [Actinidia eriantha]XP_057467386.1 toMV susceptible protein tm-2-like isoform X2 [Actinidia eriantha]